MSGNPCGRPIHKSTDDPLPVCVMHSIDQSKPGAQFNNEIKAIIAGTSKYGVANNFYDFSRFVFPIVDFSETTFQKKLEFAGAVFTSHAHFERSSFAKDADFTRCEFRASAVFSASTFKGKLTMKSAMFHGEAQFDQVLFSQDVDFTSAVFSSKAAFSTTAFHKKAVFFGTLFKEDAFFAFCKFYDESEFGASQFNGDANFQTSRFTKSVTYFSATFSQRVDFSSMVVGRYVEPGMLPTSGDAQAAFATVDLSNVVFQQPNHVNFFGINSASLDGLSIRLANCSGIEQVRFEEVRWKRLGRRIVLQDELDITSDLRQPDRSHDLVASTYKKLIRNFDSWRQYDLSEDCFCGAMEMKRLAPNHFALGRFRRVEEFYRKHTWARKFGESFSVVNLYRVLNHYGSSYLRAIMVLVLFVCLFTIAYPFLGLCMKDSRTSVTGTASTSAINTDDCATNAFYWGAAGHNYRDYVKVVGAGLWVTLDVATFQKKPTVEPASKWGRRLASLELVIIPGQAALFLLAVRRRFRR